MAVKIRLARKGRKKLAFYHIVVADSRSPRDGRYIEKIGSYNPLTNPATIELDLDRSEEHTSELQSRQYLVCRLLLEKKTVRNIHQHEAPRNGVEVKGSAVFRAR